MGDFEIHPGLYSFEAIMETACRDEDAARAMIIASPIHVQDQYRRQFVKLQQHTQRAQAVIDQARSNGQLENLIRCLM